MNEQNSRKYFSIAWLLVAAGPLAALSLAALVPGLRGVELSRIALGESIVLDAKSVTGLRLFPAGAEGAAIRADAAAKPSRVLIECAYLVPGAKLEGQAKLRIFNALAAVSSLSGVTYYSFTRGRETVLLSDVNRVLAPGSREALPDMAVRELPLDEKIELYAQDVNFGPTWYSLSIKATAAGFLLSMTNSVPQSLFLLRAFDAGALRLQYAILGLEEGVYVYGICAADPSRAAQAMADMFSAVKKRLEAVRGWAALKIKEESR